MTEIEQFALDYLPVILFLGLGVIISLLFILGSAILAPSAPDPAKNSAYEAVKCIQWQGSWYRTDIADKAL